MIDRAGNRVPALLDILAIGLGKPGGQAHHTVFEHGTFQIADPVERCPFARCQRADPFNNRFDQIGFSGGKALGLGQLGNPGIGADGEQLVLERGARRGSRQDILWAKRVEWLPHPL